MKIFIKFTLSAASLFYSLVLLSSPNEVSSNVEIDIALNKVQTKISIVIDDLGDNSIIARKMLSLPGKMTAAILPQTPHAAIISQIAMAHGHDVIMHLPMEAFSRPDLLGPGALLSTMNAEKFNEVFLQNIKSIPNVIGFNNHMGSRLTEDAEKMQWLMNIAKSNSMFFLDSKTSQSSVAEDIAYKNNVPAIARDIFLDHKGKNNSLIKQWRKAKNISRKTGKVVLICHPYPATLNFLRNNLLALNDEFNLVGLSELLYEKNNNETLPSVAR